MYMVNGLVVCLRSLYSVRASSAPLVRGVTDSSQVDDGTLLLLYDIDCRWLANVRAMFWISNAPFYM